MLTDCTNKQPFFCSSRPVELASSNIKTKGNGRYRVNGKSKALTAKEVFLKRLPREQQEEVIIEFTYLVSVGGSSHSPERFSIHSVPK
jgi:hypothetical protein